MITKDKVERDILLLNISNNYAKGMEVKQAACRAWKNRPVKEVEYVCAIAHSHIRGMFRILRWYPDIEVPERWAFDAEELPIEVWKDYADQKFRMRGPIDYTRLVI